MVRRHHELTPNPSVPALPRALVSRNLVRFKRIPNEGTLPQHLATALLLVLMLSESMNGQPLTKAW